MPPCEGHRRQNPGRARAALLAPPRALLSAYSLVAVGGLDKLERREHNNHNRWNDEVAWCVRGCDGLGEHNNAIGKIGPRVLFFLYRLIFVPTADESRTMSYNATSFDEYVLEGSASALPETKRLYNKLLSIGVKPVLLTGRTEDKRAITVANLRHQGFSGWMSLLLKQPGFKGTSVAYKPGERQKLQDAGYVIIGNIGDQWSDILGAPEGTRTFKLPDPMYYIA